MSYVTEITTLSAGAAAMAIIGQFLLMTEFYALEAQVVAVFVQGLPR